MGDVIGPVIALSASQLCWSISKKEQSKIKPTGTTMILWA